MDRVANVLSGAERTSAMSKVRRYRTDIAVLRREIIKGAKGLPAADSSIRSGGGGGGIGHGDEVEVELFGTAGGSSAAAAGARNAWDSASTHQSLNRSTALLEDSRRVVAETEEIGDGVADSLAGQRNQLLNAHSKVASCDGAGAHLTSVAQTCVGVRYGPR